MITNVPIQKQRVEAKAKPAETQRRINAGWLKLWRAVYPNTPPPTKLQPGDMLDVQFYKDSIVLRKHQPLTQEQCATLLERSRSQPKPTAEDDAAVEQVVRDVRAQRR